MPTKAIAGVSARATVEEPDIENPDGCALCGGQADGYDALAGASMCRPCEQALDRYRELVEGER
ncbi:hypothetical protein GWK26_08535 [haloarchaeon 3A1-DGR]|nr:hypothetical protein GWK26_08535 [haloarchaeon 3A1-DGR]